MPFGLTRRLGLAGLGVLAAIAVQAPLASAQEEGAAIVAPGNAVVTGFSGIVINEPPQGEDPADYLSLDLEGPAAEVADLSILGNQGELSPVPKPFTVTAQQVGQVFGVALDSAPQPNIYLAATSVYGLSIYVPDPSGTIKRVRTGADGAQFLPGQFGPPDIGGGPGSVWRVDGITGEVSLFATLDAAAQSVAGLGGVAYDPVSQQLFVVERSTGLIHRFNVDGTEGGTYDHGVEGRPAAGLSAVSPSASPPVTPQSPAFDTEDPSTWGLAQPARRVFAVAVRNSRLLYSVAQGPQVWSVGIASNGALAGNPRLEVDVPALQEGVEITSISFDGQGRMYVAERGVTVGDYQLKNLVSSGQSRVLRFEPNGNGWNPNPAQYAVGYAPNYDNADGGVALGYGYGQNGQLNPGACQATLWATGERLLDSGDPNAPPDSAQSVDGLQGNDPSLIEPQNEPPTAAWFIDYDDRPGDPENRGYVGAVTIYSPCAGVPVYKPPPPVIACPPGTVFQGGQCVVTITCPPGTSYRNGACVYPSCPPGFVLYRNQCVPPPQTCPPGTYFYNGQCVPVACPPGMRPLPNGYCACPPDRVYFQGRCVPINTCPPGFVQTPGGVCWCPLGTNFFNGKCVPQFCPPGYQNVFGKCVPKWCPPGYIKGPDGLCHPLFNPCPPGESLFYGKCVPAQCPPGTYKGKDGYCYPFLNPCKPNQILFKGQCVPVFCPPGFFKNPGGFCVPFNPCKPGQVQYLGKCVPAQCPPGQIKLPNGLCIGFGLKCPPGQKIVNGQCVSVNCGPGFVLTPQGFCLPKKPPQLKCLPGQHVNQTGTQCVPDKKALTCPQGQHVNQAGTDCVPDKQPLKCPQGQHVNQAGTQCVPDKKALNCPQGQHVNQAGTDCVPDKQPLKCPPGQHVNQAGTQCVPDKKALNCPQGQHVNQAGTDCVPDKQPLKCPPGQHVNQAGTQCVPDKKALNCPQGQHVNQAGTDCVPDKQPLLKCPPGQHPNQAGTQCVQDKAPALTCPQGQHVNQAGTQCVADKPTPLTCPQGQHPNPNGTKCVPDKAPALTCPQGQHPDAAGTQCVADQAPAVLKCPDGEHPNPKGTKCVPDTLPSLKCPNGQHPNPKGTKCVPD